MSIESKILDAVAFANLPCAYGVYDGDATTYLAFNANSIPTDFSDDAPQHERWLIQLHLFALFTTDTTTLRAQLKAALFDAGFTYPSLVDASDGGDSDRHVVFEFEGVEAVPDG